MIRFKRLSGLSMCIDERDVCKLKKSNKKYRVLHDTIGQIGTATICPVEIELDDEPIKIYLADTVTGQLYDTETMRCMSGPLMLCP